MDPEAGPEPDRSDDVINRIYLAKWIQVASKIPPSVIITFNQGIDQLLGGGILPGTLTEIFGGPGTGKTTMCMQLCITVQLPRRIQGLDGEAVFIDTEQTCTVKRFKEMINGCVEHCKAIRGFESTFTMGTLMNGIHYIPCSNLEELRNIVLDLDYFLKIHPMVKLVVVDSLAYLYYSDPLLLKAKPWMVRNKNLYYFAQEFNRLIDKYGISVVVTNTMTSKFVDGEKIEVPFLGPSWSYTPQVRLQLLNSSEQRTAIVHKHFKRVLSKEGATFRIRTAGIR